MLVSPAEPPKLRELGQVSAIPEKWGCDFLFTAHGQWVGVQRKEVNDLLSSVEDGRLAKEVAQIQQCSHRILIVEGNVNWSNEGVMIKSHTYGQQWTLRQWRGLLWSVRLKGIWVETTFDIQDTIQTLTWLEAWFKRDKHSTLERRPGPLSVWGTPTNEDYKRHLVMGLPGVGPELADRIVKRFGVPFSWKISKGELEMIDGIGKKKAETIWGGIE